MFKLESSLKAIEVLQHARNEYLKIPNYSFRAVIHNFGDYYELIVEHPCEEFLDHFNGIKLSFFNDTIPDLGHINGLRLSSTTSCQHQLFAIMIDLLDCLENEKELFEPAKWCESWKSIMGNKLANNIVYDVLSEMLILTYLNSLGLDPIWTGPDHERHDIRVSDYDCEVKSTLSRTTDAIITVAGGSQLRDTPRPVKLFVCQLERSPNGLLSVKKIKKNLIDQHYDLTELNTQFRKTGLNSSRDQSLSFNLLFPIKVYNIDDNFPNLDETCFKNDHYPPNVLNVSYTLSLSGLNYSEIEVNIIGDKIEFVEKAVTENQV